MPVLYVASDKQGAGKTAVCVGLALRWLKEDRRVVVWKPFHAETGKPPGNTDPDVATFRAVLGENSVHADPVPLPQNADPRKIASVIKDNFASPAPNQLTIVEGLPVQDAATKSGGSVAIADALDATVLLVIGFHPNVTASTIASTGSVFKNRLEGILLNGISRYQSHRVTQTLVPHLEESNIPVIGQIPEDRSLLGSTVREICEHLGGRLLQGGNYTERVVQHFMLGGLIMDSGIDYFMRRTNKAVIVRGDRPDIAMAALRTDVACLILTGGHEPIQYLQHEANEAMVPIIQVSSNTNTTADSLGTLMESAQFNHPDKARRYLELLTTHLDWQALSRFTD